jgi:hypothetical protein
MRANTTTTTSRPRHRARYVVLALVISALGIPSAATAGPVEQPTGGDSTPNAIRGGSNSGQPSDSSQATVARPNEGIVTPDHLHYAGPPKSSQATIARPNEGIVTPGHLHYAGPPLFDAGQPVASSDGIDWLSAAIGAGAAMALVALGGAVFLTVRRRTAVSPSVASMS